VEGRPADDDAAPSLKELGIPKTTKPQPWSKRGRTVL
jgi:hypothetical protein